MAFQNSSAANSLSELARNMELPTVATHPVYYGAAEQARLQKTLTAIRLNRSLKDVPSSAMAPADAYFMSAQEVESRFQDFPEAIATTAEIAERCRFDLPLGAAHMPTVPLPSGVSATQFLRQKAFAGAQTIYGEITPALQARLEHELVVRLKSNST